MTLPSPPSPVRMFRDDQLVLQLPNGYGKELADAVQRILSADDLFIESLFLHADRSPTVILNVPRVDQNEHADRLAVSNRVYLVWAGAQ